MVFDSMWLVETVFDGLLGGGSGVAGAYCGANRPRRVSSTSNLV